MSSVKENAARLDVLENLVEDLSQQLAGMATPSAPKEEKPAPKVRATFSAGGKDFQFKNANVRLNSKTRGLIFMSTSDVVKDPELLKEVIEHFDTLFEVVKKKK